MKRKTDEVLKMANGGISRVETGAIQLAQQSKSNKLEPNNNKITFMPSMPPVQHASVRYQSSFFRCQGYQGHLKATLHYVKYIIRPVSQTNVTQKMNATVTFSPCALPVEAGATIGVATVAGGAVAGCCARATASVRAGVTPSEVIVVVPPEVERPRLARKPAEDGDGSGCESRRVVPCFSGTDSEC